AEGKRRRSRAHAEDQKVADGGQVAFHLRAQRESRRARRTGHLEGTGSHGGREAKRRGQGGRGGWRRTRRQPDQYRPRPTQQEVATGLESITRQQGAYSWQTRRQRFSASIRAWPRRRPRSTQSSAKVSPITTSPC